MKKSETPVNWGKDEISKFFDDARVNQFATFNNLKEDVARLIDIDIAYRKAAVGLSHTKDWFASIFLLRAHSNYLAACRMAWSGQIPECYALLRSCIENALYGIYLANNPDSRETWLRRHDSEEHKKQVRKEFKHATMLENVKSLNDTEGTEAQNLYEITIDYGAHPNERALMKSININEDESKYEFVSIYLTNDQHQISDTLNITSRVGICVLSIFRLIYKERFDILEVTRIIDHVKRSF